MKTWVALLLALAVLTPAVLGSYGRSDTASNLALTAMKMAHVRQGISSYINDYGVIPKISRLQIEDPLPVYNPYLPTILTTPLAYLTEGDCLDPFKTFQPSEDHLPIGVPNCLFFNYFPERRWYEIGVADSDGRLIRTDSPAFHLSVPMIRFQITSFGPDLRYGPAIPTRGRGSDPVWYDPTNGSLSRGEIIVSETLGGGAVFIGSGEVPESRYDP